MERIWLNDDLNIKKLDPNDNKDVWLATELDKDKLISGFSGYLWPIHTCFNNISYLYHDSIYASPFAIYDKEKPIGYIELSDILVIKNISLVDISYAILQNERKKGYATKTLLEVTKQILTDPNVEKTILTIAKRNIASQRVAIKADFIEDKSVSLDGLISYQKTKIRAKS